MRTRRRNSIGNVAAGVILLLAAGASAGQVTRRLPSAHAPGEQWLDLRDRSELEPRQSFLESVISSRRAGGRPSLDVGLDSVVAGFTEMAAKLGIPLTPYEAKAGKGFGGVSASFRLRPGMPPLQFHIGERAPQPFAAFASPYDDWSWALRWLLRDFSIGIQSGSDSKFGYYAVGGVEWIAPDRGLAAGIGVPVHLRGAAGDAGVIFVFRVQLP